jgi:hypothetical protein
MSDLFDAFDDDQSKLNSKRKREDKEEVVSKKVKKLKM